MKRHIHENYLAILQHELVPAFGCTEPIAIAFACAKAREVLGSMPDQLELWCSGNIIKNVKSVLVPNSGGLKGMEAAAVLGAVGGDAQLELQVLESLTDEHRNTAKQLLGTGFCRCQLAEGEEKLYIRAAVWADGHSAQIEIKGHHTQITRIERDGEEIFSRQAVPQSGEQSEQGDKSLLNVQDIIAFAQTVELSHVQPLLDRQIEMNKKIAQAGLQQSYGANVGKTLLECWGDDVRNRAKAKAAAGSDARMSGCPLPVVINSGSGNQGLTVSLPVIEYAEEWAVPAEKLYRALLISNLVSIYQKYYIGNLSAYCGAVSAACGSGAGITYLSGGGVPEISRTIINTIANVGGIVCDGAKPSCAAKIASAVDAAIMGHHMGAKGQTFQGGDGIVQQDVDETIKSIGRIGRLGMEQTDKEILQIMIGQ